MRNVYVIDITIYYKLLFPFLNTSCRPIACFFLLNSSCGLRERVFKYLQMNVVQQLKQEGKHSVNSIDKWWLRGVVSISFIFSSESKTMNIVTTVASHFPRHNVCQNRRSQWWLACRLTNGGNELEYSVILSRSLVQPTFLSHCPVLTGAEIP